MIYSRHAAGAVLQTAPYLTYLMWKIFLNYFWNKPTIPFFLNWHTSTHRDTDTHINRNIVIMTWSGPKAKWNLYNMCNDNTWSINQSEVCVINLGLGMIFTVLRNNPFGEHLLNCVLFLYIIYIYIYRNKRNNNNNKNTIHCFPQEQYCISKYKHF